MIQFDPTFTLAEVARIANYLDAKIIAKPDGTHMIVPRGTQPSSNANVVKMPRHKRQYMHADLPDGPEAA